MLYLWVYFGDHAKDFYLPDTKNWNSDLCLRQDDTGWSTDTLIGIRALDAQWYISPAPGFTWQKESRPNDEKMINDGTCLVMTDGRNVIGVVVSNYQKKNTVFAKYHFPVGSRVTIGRGAGSSVRFDDKLVSSLHAEISHVSDELCMFYDKSRNGSYVNGHRVLASECSLRFGDVITIATGLKIVYLGGLLTVNKPDALQSVDMPPFSGKDAEVYATGDGLSVKVDYRRSPRLLPQPESGEIEIEPPIPRQNKEEQPMFLQIGPSMTMILPMMAGTLSGALLGGRSLMLSGIVMIGTSSMLAVAWGIVNRRHRRKEGFATEKKRVERYRAYIREVEAQLRSMNSVERLRLSDVFPSVQQCAALPGSDSYRLWERTPAHSDFLYIRMGAGDRYLPCEIKLEKKRLAIIDDPLRNEAARLKETYGKLENAPITVSLRDNAVVGVLGEESAVRLAQSIIIQAAALHSYTDLKICVVYDENSLSQWAWTRWLPHVFPSGEHSIRMSVCKPGAIHEVLSYVDEILRMRIENAREEKSDNPDGANACAPTPHYLIVCSKPELIAEHAIMNRLLRDGMGMTLLLIAPRMDRIPKECRQIISVTKDDAGLFTSNGDVVRLQYELPDAESINSFAKRIAPIRVRDLEQSTVIPAMAPFLHTYGVNRTEDLDVWRFWNENMAYDGLRSLVGLKAGGRTFTLDISERFHGPHGLIAGTTGSGKSVMLQTWILSLAINYHPDQVQFILIDYKGGGMANSFRDLPHVAGIIDNLQGERTILRALASIQGEIRRREGVFKRVGVSNIDEFIRVFHNDPDEPAIPHTLIVVDEFAELKKEKPEFMRELVSASRVGRSVGIHLILATQKPSNSVDDEIWSNTRFRICLRVSSRSDSMDMLKRPDAAYIKNMGRCFVQVGSDELFEEVQTCFSGAAYRPDAVGMEQLPHMLGDTGAPIIVRPVRKASAQREKTEMDAVIERIKQVASEHGVNPAKHLWKEEIPARLRLDSIDAYKSDHYTSGGWPAVEGHEIKAVVGLADDVARQKHIPVWVDFTSDRNHMFVGMATVGKTTALQTLVVSLASRYSPERVWFYAFSLSTRSLGTLEALPHVGGVVYEDEPEEQLRLISMLEAENARRQEMFSSAHTDSFLEYCRSCDVRRDLERAPAIIVIIDRMAQARDLLDEDAQARLFALIREGSGRGLFFVATALSLSEAPLRVQTSFHNIALELRERADYSDVLGCRLPMEMSAISRAKGRGIVKIGAEPLEMQVAVYGNGDTDVERASQIRELGENMEASWKPGALPTPIPHVPKKLTWDMLLNGQKSADRLALPIGYLALQGLPYSVNLPANYAWLVLGGQGSGKTEFLRGVSKAFMRMGATVNVVGGDSWTSYSADNGLIYFSDTNADLEKLTTDMRNTAASRAVKLKNAANQPEAEQLAMIREFRPMVVIMDDLDAYYDKLLPQFVKMMELTVSSASRFGVYVFASVSQAGVSRIRRNELFTAFIRRQSAVILSGKLSDWDFIQCGASYAVRNQSVQNGRAWLALSGQASKLCVPFG